MAQTPLLRYTLDGKPYETSDKALTAAQVLVTGGLDPALYDLTEKHGQAKPKQYADAETVHIQDGDVYLSVRVRAEVA